MRLHRETCRFEITVQNGDHEVAGEGWEVKGLLANNAFINIASQNLQVCASIVKAADKRSQCGLEITRSQERVER